METVFDGRCLFKSWIKLDLIAHSSLTSQLLVYLALISSASNKQSSFSLVQLDFCKVVDFSCFRILVVRSDGKIGHCNVMSDRPGDDLGIFNSGRICSCIHTCNITSKRNAITLRNITVFQ